MGNALLLRGLAGQPSAILVEGERIVSLDPDAATGPAVTVLDASGLRAVPGLIELQVNGVGADDFTTDPASMWRAGAALAAHGVTAFLPTIVTSPRGTVERALDALAAPASPAAGAVPIGLHVEGPFIAPTRRGAHDERHLRAPDLDEIGSWAARGMRILTLAPELPGALAAIERVTATGAVASVGHTDADAATARAAVDAGARLATHLFNGMPPLHHRRPGAAGALLDDPRVTLSLIADGVHLDPVLLRLVARAAPQRFVLVSDAIAGSLGTQQLVLDDRSARLADGTLAGSVVPLDEGVRRFAAATASPEAALAAVTSTPARLLGLDDGRGELRVGGRADIVLLDDGLGVAATIVGGQPVHVAAGVALG